MLRQMTMPDRRTPFARSMLTSSVALGQLETEGPIRYEVGRGQSVPHEQVRPNDDDGAHPVDPTAVRREREPRGRDRSPSADPAAAGIDDTAGSTPDTRVSQTRV
ncbi:hypothetical protein [Nocardia australiensis]|uniref:hypothetical protein n=1 Tax=Nocardia australiensis TaxID=2887191 RepID=UPI001D14F9B1|nr:hypothetical protein [Nocardia australiensis]